MQDLRRQYLQSNFTYTTNDFDQWRCDFYNLRRQVRELSDTGRRVLKPRVHQIS